MNIKDNYVFEGGIEELPNAETVEIHDTIPAPRLDEEVVTGIRDNVYRSALLTSLLSNGDDSYQTDDER